MSSSELSLRFSSNTEVNVAFNGNESGKLAYTNPVTAKDRVDIRWYIETYGSVSLADPDDEEADRIEERLPLSGWPWFFTLRESRWH